MNFTGYTARQLLRYHAHCRANPTGKVLPPGGRAGWDDMSAAEWLAWFATCLERKITRGTEGRGKGNRANRRLQAIADQRAECRWCGTRTGKSTKHFCLADCARAWRS